MGRWVREGRWVGEWEGTWVGESRWVSGSVNGQVGE